MTRPLTPRCPQPILATIRSAANRPLLSLLAICHRQGL